MFPANQDSSSSSSPTNASSLAENPSSSAKQSASSASSVSSSDDGNDRSGTSSRIGTNDTIIHLDVGEKTYKTRLSTLTRVPGSFLEAMVSGRHGASNVASEVSLGTSVRSAESHAFVSPRTSYFIDRDGTHFGHILNYLRCGTVVSLPRDAIGKGELAVEADFYGLVDMLLAIQSPPMDLDECLPESILYIQEEERKLRSKFAAGSGETNRLAPYAGLLSLFSAHNESNHDGSEGTSIESPLLFNAKHSLRQNRSLVYLSTVGDHNSSKAKHRQVVSVETLSDFEVNFDLNHPGILVRIGEILRTENVIIAGGSVLRALTVCDFSRTAESYWDENSDIDLFIYGSSRQEANELVRRIFIALAVDDEKWVIMRCQGVINIHNRTTKIQIILRLYDTPTEVLIGFDVDCCGCCYTGRDVKMTKRCHSALVSGINVLNPLHAWPQKPSYELRLGKYAIRGFAVYVPGLPKDQIGYCEAIQKTELIGLKGIARFIKVDFDINSSNKLHYYPHLSNELHVRASTPREIGSLRESVVEDLAPSELLVDGLADVYDRDGNLSHICDVLVPAVYGEILQLPPTPLQWFQHSFDLSSVTRNAAIETILDCSGQDDVPSSIPKRLEDAWKLEKRSREYSNDAMEKTDVDSIYYSPIYDYGKTK